METERAKLFLSPPIRFRIEWACDQERVTASLPQAHFDLAPDFGLSTGAHQLTFIEATQSPEIQNRDF